MERLFSKIRSNHYDSCLCHLYLWNQDDASKIHGKQSLFNLTMLIFKGTSKGQIRQSVSCRSAKACSEFPPSNFPGNAIYDPSNIEEYPARKNIHYRHNPFLYKDSLAECFTSSFLHPMLPEDYMSRIPAPDGAVAETGLQYPWQTPSRWTYPAALTTQEKDANGGIPRDPNDSTCEIPEVPDKKCLKRTNIPWEEKNGTKVYLKVM